MIEFPLMSPYEYTNDENKIVFEYIFKEGGDDLEAVKEYFDDNKVYRRRMS